jgi:thioredoxin reductase (NADPH)
MDTTVPILIALTAAVLLGLGAVLDDRRARYRRKHAQSASAFGLPLLHSLNNDRCIGCEACIDVCPTEVLDLVDHKVSVARFSDCVQCEQCANVCPTQALVMYREGTTPRMLTVPELDEHFQTAVPGQYLIGEVAGKPLVKNAANLGRAVIEHIARAGLQRGGGEADVLDVAIVGSGPGGLSAGLACIKHRMSCVVLEKEHVISSTVARYPKGKHFMAEPCASDNVSFLPVFDGSKEQLVEAWKHVVEGAKLPIKLGEAVEQVQRGDDGVFTIKTTVATYRARTVVLATGLRGKPRLLTVPGANFEKVQPLLDDPAEFAGEDVLVVGGGDSAVEGAIALVEVGARVTLSYRGDGFKRCKQSNQKRLAELIAGQQLSVLLSSNVKWFTRDDVTITLADGSETTIDNRRAFVLIGADTPVAWLEANHVRFIERPHLYALGSTEDVVRRYAPAAVPCPPTAAEALAILLDRPAPRSPTHRVRAVVSHLRDEIREAVTSVSSAFRLSDLETTRDMRRLTRTGQRLLPASRLVRRHAGTEPSVIVSPSFDPDVTAIRPSPLRPRSPRRPETGATPIPSFVLGVTTGTMPALRAIAPDDPTMMVAALHTRKRGGFASDTGPSVRPLEPSLVDHDASVHDSTTEAVPSLRTLERAAGLTGDPFGAATDEVAALPRELDAPTDELTSLRTRERRPAPPRADHPRTEPLSIVRAAAPAPDPDPDANHPTEVELFSLRALEHAAAHAKHDDPTILLPRERAHSESVMTSATRPIPRALVRAAVAKPAPAVPAPGRSTALPPPLPPRRTAQTASPRRTAQTASPPPPPAPRTRGSEGAASRDTPVGIAVVTDRSRASR